MSWTLLLAVVAALGVALLVALARRVEHLRMQRALQERGRTVRQGSAGAQLQYPVVDLSRCLGCATCVAVCPENGVLEIVHGQAMVVNGARCVGVSACERECPVGAITVTIANLKERTDVPVVTDGLEAVGSPGLFLAGEVTAHALIKIAIEHGTAVAAEVARRGGSPETDDLLDLCVVGAGPAGLACSLEAKRLGLSFVTLDHESGLGGTVAKYPRRKLVLTQPVDLPLHGRLKKTSYTKEELMHLWSAIATEQELPIETGQVFSGVERGDGHYVVRTGSGRWKARHVCLAIGRRGVPQRLGVPGEELPKVAYALMDAGSFRDRRILVVGGGDSAVEVATALAGQPGNRVTLSYRKESFFRVNAGNREKLEASDVDVLFLSEVKEIAPGRVELEARNGVGRKPITLPNDEVFVMAGGVAPVELLEEAGVSFDPTLRPAPEPVTEQGPGLVRALAAAFALSLFALAFALWHRGYYVLESWERPVHFKHHLLRPGRGIGLALGITAAGLILLNLAYLLRRWQKIRFGSLQAWMTGHVATGILAFLCTLLHAAMSPRSTPGGHAFWALLALLVTGAIGRYFYAWVPRAANGRELELEEVKARLAQDSEQRSHGQRRFRERAREEVETLVERRQWRGSFFGRVLALFGVQRDLRHALRRIAREGNREGVSHADLLDTLTLARRAHRHALMAAHFEDLRGILGAWRYFHRWIALLMVLLLVAHVVNALLYGGVAA